MAMERVFDCPRTLMRLRTGPLGKLLEGFCNWLMVGGFTRGCIRTHLSNVSHLNEYLSKATTQPRARVTAKDIEGFFKAYPSQCRNHGPLEGHLRRVRYSINRFADYLGSKGLFEPLVSVPIYQQLLDGYLQWLRHYHHAAEGTLELRAHSISRFLKWLGPQATAQRLGRLTPESIETFLLSYAQAMGRSARRPMQAALRTFMRFCLHQGNIEQPLDQAVPILRTYKLSTVPRGLSEQQAQRVIESVDCSTHTGLRDYAILQLLHTYGGVRGGQVRALRMEDIHWADNQILFRALKNGKDSLLPLSLQVGQSLLDYLRQARPRCSYPPSLSNLSGAISPLGSFQLAFGNCGPTYPCRGGECFQPRRPCIPARFCHPHGKQGIFA
jgi:site-specific recombinase XerD